MSSHNPNPTSTAATLRSAARSTASLLTGRASAPVPSQVIYVPRNILKNATDNALRKQFFRLSERLPRRVTVESNPLARSDSVFYAPFPPAAPAAPAAGVTAVPTEFLSFAPDPARTPDLVHAADAFTMSFAGMFIPPFDSRLRFRPRNDLLLYSLAPPPPPPPAPQGGSGLSTSLDMLSAAGLTRRASNLRRCIIPDERKVPAAMRTARQADAAFTAAQRDLQPTIHYDPFADGKAAGTTADTYVPVPHSKAVFYRHKPRALARRRPPRPGARAGAHGQGQEVGEEEEANFVPVRFSVMEIDHVSPGTAAAVEEIEKLNGVAGQKIPIVPYGAVVTAAVDVATSLGHQGLRRYARPNHVLTTDIRFQLYDGERAAAREGVQQQRAGSPAEEMEEDEDMDEGEEIDFGDMENHSEISEETDDIVTDTRTPTTATAARPPAPPARDSNTAPTTRGVSGGAAADSGPSPSQQQQQQPSSERTRARELPKFPGNYLRYGYYFFLREKVDARLYAQTFTSTQNVPLLLRRTGLMAKRLEKGERHMFPLSGVSYVVIKVTPGSDGRRDPTQEEKAEDRERLEHILSMGAALGELASLQG